MSHSGIIYLCPCGARTSNASVKITQVYSFAYLRCQQCGYPCPDKDVTSTTLCPICKKKQAANLPAVCIVDTRTDVLECIGCEGVVPVDELMQYTSQLARLEAKEKTIAPATATQVSPGSRDSCLLNHRVTCNHIDGQIYMDCPSPCSRVSQVSNRDSEAVKERAGRLLTLCTNCQRSDYRRVVIEEGEWLLVKCCRQYRLPNWPSITSRFTTGVWGAAADKLMPVKKLEDLQVADHILYKRQLYDHHALVSSIDPLSGVFTQIHYTEGSTTLSGGTVQEGGGGGGLLTKGVVLDKEQRFDEISGPWFIVVYAPLDCFSPAKVISRAQSRLNEACYNLVTSNCEHLVRWCKVGEARSGQVDSLVQASEEMTGRGGSLMRGGLVAAQVLSDPAVRQVIGALWSRYNAKK